MEFFLHVDCNGYAKSDANQREKFPPAAKVLENPAPDFSVHLLTGKRYLENWARFAAILMFFAFNFTFFPQLLVGYLGMPRRYHVYPPEFQTLSHVLDRRAGACSRPCAANR